MNTFTALDFETVQGKRWSICQVGIVRVENGVIVETVNKLVCPPNNFYFYKNTEIHGIDSSHTYNSPTFPKVWEEIKHLIQGRTVVAHNGAFDFNCLKQTIDFYRLEHPEYVQACTYKIFGADLATLCRKHKIQLNHHDALSDAMACAKLYLMHLEKQK
ncbi:MAG: 3'-5' exonuclease [Bacteroidota bacterium]